MSDDAPTCPAFGCGLADVKIPAEGGFDPSDSDVREVILRRDSHDRLTAFQCGSCDSILSVCKYQHEPRYQRASNPPSPSEEDLLAAELACPSCGEHVVPSMSGYYRFSPIAERSEWSRMAYCPECDAILGTTTEPV